VNHFQKNVAIEGEILSFSFYRVDRAQNEKKFLVSVTKSHKAFVFEMKKDTSGAWHVTESAPEWVKPFQWQLSQIIKGE